MKKNLQSSFLWRSAEICWFWSSGHIHHPDTHTILLCTAAHFIKSCRYRALNNYWALMNRFPCKTKCRPSSLLMPAILQSRNAGHTFVQPMLSHRFIRTIKIFQGLIVFFFFTVIYVKCHLVIEWICKSIKKIKKLSPTVFISNIRISLISVGLGMAWLLVPPRNSLWSSHRMVRKEKKQNKQRVCGWKKILLIRRFSSKIGLNCWKGYNTS